RAGASRILLRHCRCCTVWARELLWRYSAGAMPARCTAARALQNSRICACSARSNNSRSASTISNKNLPPIPNLRKEESLPNALDEVLTAERTAMGLKSGRHATWLTLKTFVCCLAMPMVAWAAEDFVGKFQNDKLGMEITAESAGAFRGTIH